MKTTKLKVFALLLSIAVLSCDKKNLTTGDCARYFISSHLEGDAPIDSTKPLSAKKVYDILKTNDVEYFHVREREYLKYLVKSDSILGILVDKECFQDNRSDSLMKRWPPKRGTSVPLNWYMDTAHSGLEKAYKMVYNQENKTYPVRIAHIDTGLDPKHPAFFDEKGEPLINIIEECNILEVNERSIDIKPYRKGSQILNYGHGSATLGLIAVNTFNIGGKELRIGGNPKAEIVVIRATYGSPLFLEMNSVKQAIEGFEQAIGMGCDIISFSHGGTLLKGNRAFEKVLKKAYDKGIVVVAAAGNNYEGVRDPDINFWKRHWGNIIPVPASYDKYTIAVSAATYDLKPYIFELYPPQREKGDCIMEHMQMSWRRDYENQPLNIIAGYSPNIPFVKAGSDHFKFNGGGTSASVPQVASAVSLYIAKYRDLLEKIALLGKPHLKVELIKQALFQSARKINDVPHFDGLDDSVFVQYFGNGLLNSVEMLNIKPDLSNLKSKSLSISDSESTIETINFELLSKLFDLKKLEKFINQQSKYNVYQLRFLDYILQLLCIRDLCFQNFLEKSLEYPAKRKDLIEYLLNNKELDKTSRKILREIHNGIG